MEPPHNQGRAVLRIPLQAQPVPPVYHVISSTLRSCTGSFLPLLSLCLVLVSILIGTSGRRWRLGRGAAGAPRRQCRDAGGQEAGLGLWRRHPIQRRDGAAACECTEPALRSALCVLSKAVVWGESRGAEGLYSCSGGRGERWLRCYTPERWSKE